MKIKEFTLSGPARSVACSITAGQIELISAHSTSQDPYLVLRDFHFDLSSGLGTILSTKFLT